MQLENSDDMRSQEGEDDQDNMDLFSENFNVAFVKSLLKLQGQIIHLPNSKEHYDIYLAQKLYPVLVPALEELSKEIKRIQDNTAVIDSSIRERFNPCIYLGEFLMRNNPKHGTKLEYEQLFESWSHYEKLRRFFHLRRQKINKHFSQQPYH